MKFLIDRCAGRRVAEWLSQQGHDVCRVEGNDPGDAALLQMAVHEQRVVVTIDTDFGFLVYHGAAAHAGIIRLPDVPAVQRIALLQQILDGREESEIAGALITATRDRIRFSRWPS